MEKMILLFVLCLAVCICATPLGDLAAQMQAGQWRELSTNGFNNGNILVPSTGIGSILQYADEAQWDPVGRKVYIIGTSRGSGNYGHSNQAWVVYNESTNTWSAMPNPSFYIGAHSYDHAAIDPANGMYYIRLAGKTDVRRCNLANTYWSGLPAIPTGWTTCCTGLEYFPELNGVVFVAPQDGGGKFYLFNTSTNQWSSIPEPFAVGHYHVIAKYNPVHQFLYFGGGNDGNPSGLYKLDKDKGVTRLADAPVSLGTNSGVHTVDPVSGKLLVFARNKSTYVYDPAGNAWKTAGSHSLVDPYDNIVSVAVSLPEYSVNLIVRHGYDNVGKVYLYKHSAGNAVQNQSCPQKNSDYTISVNPNPFKTAVTFGFSRAGKVNIYIYRVDGTRIAEFRDIQGPSLTWRPKGLSKGIYILRWMAGGRMLGIKKLMVM
jgi:hypothetical protein